MKKNVKRFLFVMIAVVVMYPTSWAVAQTPNSLRSANASSVGDIPSNETSQCDPDLVDLPGMPTRDYDPEDPNIPCTQELYYFSSDEYAPEPQSVTKNITCGVVWKNKFGTVVAKLWENVNVTWKSTSWEFSATRGTWVLNSAYGWAALSGPTPSSGSGGYGQTQSIVTRGTVKYLGGWWYARSVWVSVSGKQDQPYWSCNVQ